MFNPFADNYPFINPPYNTPSIAKAIYDVYITYYDPTLQYKLPFKLISLTGNSVVIQDNDGVDLYNGNLVRTSWGNKYYVLQGTQDNVSVAILTDYTRLRPIYPDNPELCLRCVNLQPKHVTSIEVNSVRIDNDLSINEGYNTNYSVEAYDDSFRPTTLITINADPGTGLGKVKKNCAEVEPKVRTINSIEGDENDNVYLYGDACATVTQSNVNELSLTDECVPCCQCKDFSRAAEVLDNLINSYYEKGAAAEEARDCAKELIEMVQCGGAIPPGCEELCPIRVYIDVTWPRYPIITVEFRNVLPAIVTNLTVTVICTCSMMSKLEKHETLRTMSVQEVSCNKPEIESQEEDNKAKITIIENNKFIIDWSEELIQPGQTLWATIRARNGGPEKKADESITATATADYDLAKFRCVPNQCIQDLNVRKTDSTTATIKGGFGYADFTIRKKDTDDSDSTGDIDRAEEKRRVYEICRELEEDNVR